MGAVQFAFETGCDIVDVGEAIFFQEFTGFPGSIARTADEHYRAMRLGHSTYFIQKTRVQFPVRSLIPGDQQAIGGVADEEEFQFRAAVDEYRIRGISEKFEGFPWGQVVHGSLL